ncbi:MAG TPA: hypothetical protein VJ044_03900, partial [Candidatus Hodarchaeales archaeon]|nr:hypothetical protein [Candidatus Hodarchaeales archaeon]
MSDNWFTALLEKNANEIIEFMSLQVGADFQSLREVSRVSIENRFGPTVVAEIRLLTNDSSKEEYTLGFIAKKVRDPDKSIDAVLGSSKRFTELMESKQAQWAKNKKTIKDFSSLEKYGLPDRVFAPKVRTIEKESGIIQFEILPRFVTRPKSGVPPDHRYVLAGYALARMHGFSGQRPPKYDNYASWFDYLTKKGLAANYRETWEKSLRSSKGGLDFSFGEYSLDSIYYNSLSPGKGQLDSLCIVDPVLVAGGDRGEDLGYLIYFILERTVDAAVRKVARPEEVSTKQILVQTMEQVIVKTVPLIVRSYLTLYPGLAGDYTDVVPIDFFAGAYLTSRADQYGTSTTYTV